MTSKSKSRKRALPEGFMCFSLGDSSPAQRSSYSDKRRQQVHEVRKVGACLRCQLLKKSCSKGEPCTTCIRAAAKNSASRSLAWMSCIRPSLCNLTIYGSASHYNPDLKLGGVPVLQYLAHGDVDLKFDIPFQWNIDELSTFVAGWLANDHDAPRASMVGIMSSASLLSVIADLVGPELAQVFKALIYTSSLIFNSSNDQHTYSDQSTDIKILRHCGYRLLQHLDSQIRPTTLARLKKHELYAMFLLLLGCIISSKYVFESLGDLSRLTLASVTNTTHQQVQPSIINSADANRGSELVRLLSHQMVYIGQTTGLIQDGAENDLIGDLTSLRWRKEAIFTWETSDKPQTAASWALLNEELQTSDSSIMECDNESLSARSQLQATQASSSSSQQQPLSQWQRKHKIDTSTRTRASLLRRTGACHSCQSRKLSCQVGRSCRQCLNQHAARTSPWNSLTIDFDTPVTRTVRDLCSVFLEGAGLDPCYQSTWDSSSVPMNFSSCESAVSRMQSHTTPHIQQTRRPNESMPNALYDTLDVGHKDTDLTMPDFAPYGVTDGSIGVPDEYSQLQNMIMASSTPLNFEMAAFDPDLPTLGMDDKLFQDDAGFGFAFESRMPTPPPMDMEFDLQLQLKEIGDRFQILHETNFSVAAPPACFHGAETGSTSLHNDLFGPRQRRLLL